MSDDIDNTDEDMDLLDEDIMDSEEEFDEFSQKSKLSDTIRQSPVAKIVIVVIAIILVGGVLIMFGSDGVEDKVSVIPPGSEITSVPGGDEKVAPAYIEAVEEQNEADLERAMLEGGSTIPVPIETQDTRLEVPELEEESEDPLHRWRVLQEERIEREMQAKEVEIEPVTVLDAQQQSEAINALAQSMVEQMESVLNANSAEASFNTKTLITYEAQLDDLGRGGNISNADNAANADQENNEFVGDTEEIVVIPAGKIVYGQMLLEANSDVPSVVLAQMVSGPLKGWKLLGEFAVAENIELLTINFNLAVNEDGKQFEVDAVMLNPDTSLAALATDVDHRYIRRIILPAAASFIEGFADAIADSGRTTVTVQGETVIENDEETTDEQEVATGVTEAADEIGTILDDLADVPVRIIIDAGTPIGIFFAQNVVETESDI